MTSRELVLALETIRIEQIHGIRRDTEQDHADADRLLLDYIGADDVSAAFADIAKWYA